MATGHGSVRIISERPAIPPTDSAITSPAPVVDAEPWQPDTEPSTSRATAPGSPTSRPEYLNQMTATFSAISMVLAARMLVLLALIGAFTLAMMTVTEPSNNRLIANGIFDVLVFLPLVWLYAARG